jgi:putative acetyltransferase
MTITIDSLDPASDQAETLIEELNTYLLDLYPPESNHIDSVEELSRTHVHFLGAFEDGRPVGCGAIKLFRSYAEIKRIYINPDHRGKGTGRLILSALENIAHHAEIDTVRLESGVRQPEALLLFENNGYRRTSRYGDYFDDPLSVFMEKVLAPDA